MPAGRGSRIAIAVASLAALSLTLAASFSWRSISESWWLHRLESGERPARIYAIQRLGAMKSRKAIPELAQMLSVASDDEIEEALVKAMVNMGTVEFLFQVIDDTKLRSRFALELLSDGGAREAAALELLRIQDENGPSPWVVKLLVTDRGIGLDRSHPSVQEVLRQRRDRLETKILEEAARTNWLKGALGALRVGGECDHLGWLNEVLQEPERTLEIHDRAGGLHGGDAVRRNLEHHAVLARWKLAGEDRKPLRRSQKF